MSVSMRDIARHAGVSVNTVSKVLRDAPGVGTATRERVRAVACELGYQRNPAFGVLAEHKRGGRAHHQRVCLFATGAFADQERYRSLWRSCRQCCADYGYAITEQPVERLPDRSEIALDVWCEERGFAGAVLVTQSWRDPRRFTTAGALPLVVLGAALEPIAAPRVCTDDFHDGRLAYDRLEELGCTRIGLVLGEVSDGNSGGRWSAAFAASLERRGIADPGRRWRWSHRPGLAAWIRDGGYDALLVATGEAEREVAAARAELGSGPHPLVARIGLRDSAGECLGVLQDLDRLGAIAIDQLDLQLRRGRREGPVTITVPGTWVDRRRSVLSPGPAAG